MTEGSNALSSSNLRIVAHEYVITGPNGIFCSAGVHAEEESVIPIAFNFPPDVLPGRELKHDALTEDSDRLEALVPCHILVAGSAACLDSISAYHVGCPGN